MIYDANGSVLYSEKDIYEIPPYWKNHMENKVDTLKANEDAIGSTMAAFIFITDPHWSGKNFKKSPHLVRYIQKNYRDIPVFCGGDIISSFNGTKAGAINELRNYTKIFREAADMKIIAIGNHDSNAESSGGSSAPEEAHLSDGDLYNLLVRQAEDICTTSRDTNGMYFDNPSQRVRYIIARLEGQNSHNSAVNTYIDALVSDMPDGWTFVLIVHQTPLINASGLNAAKTAGGATNKNGIIIAGHEHADANGSVGTTIFVRTICDAGGLISAMKEASTTEQAFDVVQLDLANRHAYFTRIGYGSDRDFAY